MMKVISSLESLSHYSQSTGHPTELAIYNRFLLSASVVWTGSKCK